VYVLVAVGELFACVTALEYACNHSPKSIEAIVQAINLLVAGMGSACTMGLTPTAKDPYIRLLYACLACAMAAMTLVFW
jgi:POT family proton-dependent oligopeptide transporter